MFRAVITKALRQPSSNQLKLNIGETSTTKLACSSNSCQKRNRHSDSSTYLKSTVEQGPEKYTAFEKSYEEWKYVEKLIPPEHVPQAPIDPAVELPSGWRAPNPPLDRGYLIQRSMNHMVPVYLDLSYRGQRQITRIKNVVGNIFKLEEDIGRYLQPFFKVPVITYVNEPARTVHIKGGDKFELTKKWVINQGF